MLVRVFLPFDIELQLIKKLGSGLACLFVMIDLMSIKQTRVSEREKRVKIKMLSEK